MIVKVTQLVIILVILPHLNCQDVSDSNYALMPDLFHLDDYDKCMLLGDEAVYCTFTFNLKPLHFGNYTFIWDVIKNVSSNPRNYRHDKLRHGICLQLACRNTTSSSPRDIQECYNKKLEYLGLEGTVSDLKCQSNERDFNINIFDIIIGLFFLFYIIFVIFASLYEGMARYQKQEVYERITRTLGKLSLTGKLISAFSLPKNWSRLCSQNNDPDARKLRSIQGIRVYNLMCVIMCHTLMITFSLPVSNTKFVENLTNDVLNTFITNGNYVVQTFFVISGWLLSFHFFQTLETKKNLKISDIFFAFLNRYIRLTPVLAVTVAFESTWLPYMGKGPSWDQAVGEDYRNCRKNWWTNLLYVNNYVDKNNMCLHQTWYIASDTQLYVCSLIILWFVRNNQKRLKIVFGGIIIFGLILQGCLAYFNQYDIVVRQYPEVLYALKGIRAKEWHTMYSSGYSNIVGYTIGLSFGYIFYKCRNKVILINKYHMILWWILTFGMCDFVVLIAAKVYQPGYVTTPFLSALYWTLGKNLFALGLAIGILGFSRKIGWFARWFCEWKSVTVLGRLTYSTYIVHVTLIRIKGGLQRQPFYIDEYLLLLSVLGDITLSYLIGTLVCLLFEMPMSALQKLTVPQLKKTKKSSEKSLKTLDDCEEEKNLSKM